MKCALSIFALYSSQSGKYSVKGNNDTTGSRQFLVASESEENNSPVFLNPMFSDEEN